MQVSSNAANSARAYPIGANRNFSNDNSKDRSQSTAIDERSGLPRIDVAIMESTTSRTNQNTTEAQVREEGKARPRSGAKTGREKFCHTIATMSGWLAGGVYGLTFVWIPMLLVGAVAGTFNEAADRTFNLQQDKPFKDGLWTTVCSVPALIGGTIALAMWIATSPIALAVEAYEQYNGVADSARRGVVASLTHAMAQGKSTGGVSWARILGVKV